MGKVTDEGLLRFQFLTTNGDTYSTNQRYEKKEYRVAPELSQVHTGQEKQ